MKCVALVVVLLAIVRSSQAGRAFSIEAENFVVEEFRKLNPRLEWDPTNFLIDLSGRYALCDNINVKGSMQVDRTTQDGASIGAMVDSTQGTGTDSEAVTSYLVEALPTWRYKSPFRQQIMSATKFGCSVQPGCRGRVSFACLFSPRDNFGGNYGEATANPKALAFTPEQYLLAERILGAEWDRSHFVENLSGWETDCAMIEAEEWSFANAKKKAEENGMSIYGLYGSAPNAGDTEQAMTTILESWKTQYSARKFKKQVGCSLIPDCWRTGRGDMRVMYVTVSCLFEY